MSKVFRSFMAQAARGGRFRRNFSSLPEESTGAGMIRELANLPVATALPVGYFIGFLFHYNELGAAEKEVIMRRLEKVKRIKLACGKDTSETSLKSCWKKRWMQLLIDNLG